MLSDAVKADRVVGAVLGSAAGDALGAGYEFGPALAEDAPVTMKGGGGFEWEPGEWTDDTQMALAILAPLAGGTSALAGIEAGFRAWFTSRPADVGNQTRAVLSRPEPLRDAAAAYQSAHPDGAGNGSLMRTGPVALAHLGNRHAIAGFAADVSALTHLHPDCVDACVLWSLAIDHCIGTAPVDGHPDWLGAVRAGIPFLPADRQDRWAVLIDEAGAGSPRRFTNNGWVVHAFQAALAAITDTPVPADEPCRHLELALANAVRCGGDTDTVAAIAGSLLGARWGATAVPLQWQRLLHGRTTYSAPPITATHLDHMARLAPRGGGRDTQGWPGIERMLPYYQAKYRAAPVNVTLSGAVFGNVAGVPQALDNAARSVISLCRMGTEDIPADREHVTIGLLDTAAADNPNLVVVLSDIADDIARSVAHGESVYVHCVAGEHRTPAVAAAFLIRHHGRGVDGALHEVQKAFGRTPREFLVAGLHGIRPEPHSFGQR